MDFQPGDVVRGKGPYPFDLYGYTYTVLEVNGARIGKPCHLRRCADGAPVLPTPSDMLELVKRPGRNLEDKVRSLRDEVKRLKEEVRELRRNQR